MRVLPPGTILQLMYLKERLRLLPPGFFVEIGPGQGAITELLLRRGWRGRVFELSATTAAQLRCRFASEVAAGQLSVENRSFLRTQGAADLDLVISCMVMEHLADREQEDLWHIAAAHLRPGGLMIGLVPASPAHWGIEDEIAGHQRRYTRTSLGQLAAALRWRLTHVAGLTFPLSNLLLPLSNVLVARQERAKLRLSAGERTRQSGRRDVIFKTRFPLALKLLLNEMVMLPLHLLQKWLSSSPRAMVLYFEAQPPAAPSPRP